MNTMNLNLEVPLTLEFMEKMSVLMRIFSTTSDFSEFFVELVEFADGVFDEEVECDCDPDCESCPLCEVPEVDLTEIYNYFKYNTKN